MRSFLAAHPRTRSVLAWIGLIAAMAVLLHWVEPSAFESPYNNF